MAGKKIKFGEDTISEIQVADTDSESDAKATEVEDYLEEEEEEEEQQRQLQASAEFEPQTATSGWLPTWGPPQGRNTNIHLLLVQQKVDHEIVFPPSGSNSTQQLDTVTFKWG